MKKKINIIDLDNTLIPFDSFRKYVIMILKFPNMILFVLALTFIRKLKIISSSNYKKHIIIKAKRIPNYDQIMKKFAKELYSNRNNKIIDIINEYTDKDTILILCTASIDDYVKHLALLLGWKYICSHIKYTNSEKVFNHMYGIEKIRALEKQYPPEMYIYNFAISDNISDKKLLLKFNKYISLNNAF